MEGFLHYQGRWKQNYMRCVGIPKPIIRLNLWYLNFFFFPLKLYFSIKNGSLSSWKTDIKALIIIKMVVMAKKFWMQSWVVLERLLRWIRYQSFFYNFLLIFQFKKLFDEGKDPFHSLFNILYPSPQISLATK